DLGAERAVEAEKEGERIVIEIKSFVGSSPIFEFERALGQYLIYRDLLGLAGIERTIHLAVSSTAFRDFFSRPSIDMILKIHNVSLIVIDVETQEVTKWTK